MSFGLEFVNIRDEGEREVWNSGYRWREGYYEKLRVKTKQKQFVHEGKLLKKLQVHIKQHTTIS